MRACNQCGKEAWKFKGDGGFTVARCTCGHEIRFLKKKKQPKVKCERCHSTNLDKTKIEIKAEVLLQPHYFLYKYTCKKCGNEQPDKTTKRINALF